MQIALLRISACWIGAAIFVLPLISGAYLTVNRGHAALMGVYGNLSLYSLARLWLSACATVSSSVTAP